VYENDALQVKTMVVRTSPVLLVAVKSGDGLALYSKMFGGKEKERLELSHISSAPARGPLFRAAGTGTVPLLMMLAGLALFIAAFHGAAGEILSGRTAALFAVSPVLLILLLCFASDHLPFPLNSANGSQLFLNVAYFDALLQSDFRTAIPVSGTFTGSGILTSLLVISALLFCFSMLPGLPGGPRGRLILFKTYGFFLLLSGIIPSALAVFRFPLQASPADISGWFSNKILPVIAPEQTILDVNPSGAGPFSLSPAGLLPFALIPVFYGTYLLLYGFGMIKPPAKKSLPTIALVSFSFLLILAAAFSQLFEDPGNAIALAGSCSAVSGALFSLKTGGGIRTNICILTVLFILFFAFIAGFN